MPAICDLDLDELMGSMARVIEMEMAHEIQRRLRGVILY
jgi:hypothetical protein